MYRQWTLKECKKIALFVHSEYIDGETEDRVVPPILQRKVGENAKEFASQFGWKRKYIGCYGIRSKEEIKKQMQILFFNHKHKSEEVILCEAFWFPGKNQTSILYYYTEPIPKIVNDSKNI